MPGSEECQLHVSCHFMLWEQMLFSANSIKLSENPNVLHLQAIPMHTLDPGLQVLQTAVIYREGWFPGPGALANWPSAGSLDSPFHSDCLLHNTALA